MTNQFVTIRLIAVFLALSAQDARAQEPTSPKLVEAGERIAKRFVDADKHERNYRFDLALEALLEMSEATGKPIYRECREPPYFTDLVGKN